MKKIAILTLYYHNYNYGGLLQAYALQKAVSQLGYDAKQISYILDSGNAEWNPVVAKIKTPLRYMRLWIRHGKWAYGYLKRRSALDAFALKIPHTKVVSANNIGMLQHDFDCFICGSDQIWNPIGWQPTLFLDFLDHDVQRISYAASVSRERLSEEEYEFMEKYLCTFSAISVREKNTADMLNSKFPGWNVQYTPDPVFLLTADQWKEIYLKGKTHNAEPYIFAYFLGDNHENREKAIRYARSLNLKIVFASYLNADHFVWEREHMEFLTPVLGVEDFLRCISGASVVLTDSFHAVAFSAILKTPFYAFPRFRDNDNNSMNSRIRNVVRELNIPQRYTDEPDTTYDWIGNELSNVKSNLERMRESGLMYLRRSIL